MKNLWKKYWFKRYVALFLSVVLLISGGYSVRAIDMIYSDQNHHYLIYNNIDALFEKMSLAYQENNFAILGENVFLPMEEASMIESGEELLIEINQKLSGKYLIETIYVSDGLTLYFTADVLTLEIFLLLSNATKEEHSFTIIFADGMEFDEIATAYSFEAKELELVPTVTPVSGAAIVINPPEPVDNDDNTGITDPVEEQDDEVITDPVEDEDDEVITDPVEEQDDEVITDPVEEQDDEVITVPVEEQDDEVITDPVEEQDDEVITVPVEDEDDEVITDPVEDEDDDEYSLFRMDTMNGYRDDNSLISDVYFENNSPINEDEAGEGENPINEDEDNEEVESPINEDEKPLLVTTISSLAALNSLSNLSLSFVVGATSANTLNGTITDILEVNPTIDKTGYKNEDGSYTIKLSVIGDQDESTEIIKQSYPINLVFAIDVSTSMNNSISGGSASSSNPSRWKLLVDQMNAMVDYVLNSTTGNVQSKISIIAYASNNKNFLQGKYYMLLADQSSDANAIKNSYSILQANGTRTPKSIVDIKGDNNYGTNNHAGFLGVRERLSFVTTNTNSTYVIYLTDGEANRYLIPASNGNYTQSSAVSASDAIPPALTEARAIKQAFPNKTIKIYTIGIGNDSNNIAKLLNPSSNPYQDKYYSINNVADFTQIFTDLSKEITETNIIYVTNMNISDTLSQYVNLEPNSFVIKYNNGIVYDNSNPTSIINVNGWPNEFLPQYNSSNRTISWRIMDSEGKLGPTQTYELSYKVSVNNETLPLAPSTDLYYAYYDDWNRDGIREIRYYNTQQAAIRGLSNADKVDNEIYYPSNNVAEIEYYNGTTISSLIFPHPAVKADIKGSLIIKKDLTNTSDNTDKEFIFEVRIGENGAIPSLYNGVATVFDGVSLTNYNIVNGLLKLRANELATIKLTTIKSSYSVTELNYVDDSGYSESTLDNIHREVVKSLNQEHVSSDVVVPTIVPTGSNVTGNLYKVINTIEDDTEGYWQSRDIDDGVAGNWNQIIVDDELKRIINELPINEENYPYETGKLDQNGNLEKLPAPIEYVNGYYNGDKESDNWVYWSNSSNLSFNSNGSRVRDGSRQYNYSGWKTASTIYQNYFRTYDGYVETATGSGTNVKYVIYFYKIRNTTDYQDIRLYRYIHGTEGGETTITTPLDVTLTFTNNYTDIDGSIEVNKVINEFLPQHGNAVFFFRLDKLNEDDEVIESNFDFIEFQSLTNGNGVRFEHLPKGRYRLTEIQPIRYEFESVDAEGANADSTNANINTNGEITFEITGDMQEGIAVYYNKKIYEKYFSHTDVKRNTITIAQTTNNAP